MTENTEQSPEIELQIAPLEQSITRQTARMTYQFIMPSLVARLYLYLFGEFDKDVIELAVERIAEYNTVMREILDKKKGPLRSIYDYLIAQEILEDQKLAPAALVYLDEHDQIQMRIIDEDPEVQ